MTRIDKKLTDLLSDESFVCWIKGRGTVGDRRKWDAWEQRDPLHGEIKKRAGLLYDIPMGGVESGDIKHQLHKLNRHIDNNTQISRSTRSKGYPLIAAAVVLVLLVIVSFLSLDMGQSAETSEKLSFKSIEVGSGERTTLKISDGSQIHLNSNSTLRYKPAQLNTNRVDVWLEGEGYFSITHAPEGRDRVFVVHTPDGEIQELGTKFNVNTNFDGTTIVLEEGKVKLILQSPDQKTRHETVMKPGEKAVLDSSRESIAIQNIDPSLYTAWVEGKMKFHDTPLKEIIRQIEVTYGVSITVADSRLLNEKVSGSLQNPNLKVLIAGLKQTLNLNIKQESESNFLISA